MAVTEKNSRSAVTHWEVVARYVGYTHIRCRLETGRTHQIRVHMAHIGHPLLGDELYSPREKAGKGLTGQCLHARAIEFTHPRTLERLRFGDGAARVLHRRALPAGAGDRIRRCWKWTTTPPR